MGSGLVKAPKKQTRESDDTTDRPTLDHGRNIVPDERPPPYPGPPLLYPRLPEKNECIGDSLPQNASTSRDVHPQVGDRRDRYAEASDEVRQQSNMIKRLKDESELMKQQLKEKDGALKNMSQEMEAMKGQYMKKSEVESLIYAHKLSNPTAQAMDEQIQFDVRFKKASSTPRLEDYSWVAMKGYNKVVTSCVWMDLNRGVFRTPRPGLYEFGIVGGQKDFGTLRWNLDTSDKRSTVPLAVTKGNGAQCCVSVEWECPEGTRVWVVVRRDFVGTEVEYCQFYGRFVRGIANRDYEKDTRPPAAFLNAGERLLHRLSLMRRYNNY